MTVVDDPRDTETRGAASRALPLGAITPRGWLRDQLRLQADGQTGHLEEVWPDVGPDSGWKGGPGEDWERGPYYLDGLVPLAHTLGDERLLALARPWIEWTLASQREDGMFGPVTNDDWWPRMVMLKVLIQHAEATGDERVEPFLERYFRHQAEALPSRPLSSWGRARGADNALAVHWLWRRTGEDWLMDLHRLLLSQTTDWNTQLTERLITGAARVFAHEIHGPNVAMGLKTGAVAALADGDFAGHAADTERALAELDRWHGQAHGWFSGDEWLGGREATAGVETCQVVELMFTAEQVAAIVPDGVWGDRLESLAFNLMPASNDPRMLAHQYHQQANQVRVSVAERPWTHSSDDANLFGLEPHFGCCTANLHQGWPKFTASLWLQDADGGLRTIAWAPAAIAAEVDGRPVRLEVTTDYPFDETVTVRVGVDGLTRATLRLRIPAWATEATLAVAGDPVPVHPVDGYVELDREWSDGDEIVLVLPMTPRVIHRERQSVALRLGPLVLSATPGENWLPVPGAPGLGEWEVHPRSTWAWAIDVADPASWRIERRTPGAVPWALDQAAVRIRVPAARPTHWDLDGANAAVPPPSPVTDYGPMVGTTLVPYGVARLRVTELPVLLPRHDAEE